MIYLDIIWELASSGDPVFWMMLVIFTFIVSGTIMGGTYYDYTANCKELFYRLSTEYPTIWKEIEEPVLWADIYSFKKQRLMDFITSIEILSDREIKILCIKIRREYYVTNIAGLTTIFLVPIFIILSMFI